MVNFSINLASLSGFALAVAGVALYALRSFRPELSREQDTFFSAVGLLYGLLLVFYGWQFEPIMQFGQVLFTGAVIFFAVEDLRLRGVVTALAKRNTPVDDEDIWSEHDEWSDDEPPPRSTVGRRPWGPQPPEPLSAAASIESPDPLVP